MSRRIFIHRRERTGCGWYLFANNLRAFHQRAIVDQRRPALTAGGVVFGFMEAEAADMADGAQRAPCRWTSPLCGVFHHKQVVFVGDGHDGVHLAGYAGIMHRTIARVLSVMAASMSVSSIFIVSRRISTKTIFARAAQRRWRWRQRYSWA